MSNTRCIVCQTADGGFRMENVCLNCGETVAGLKVQRDALLAALKSIAKFRDAKCQTASAEMLYALLDLKVGIARAAIAAAAPDKRGE